MLFLLSYPAALLGAAIGLLGGTILHGVVQARVAGMLGDRQALMSGRGAPDPRRHFDAFGVVAAVLAGVTWGKPVPLTVPRFGGRGRYVWCILAGPLTRVALGLLAFVGYAAASGSVVKIEFDQGPGFGQVLLWAMGWYSLLSGVLTLFPLPPLDGARLLWLWAPQTDGWRRARYFLEEQNGGVLILLALSLPIFSQDGGLLTRAAAAIARPLRDALLGAFGIDI